MGLLVVLSWHCHITYTAGAPPQTPLGSLQRSPDPLAGFKGSYFYTWWKMLTPICPYCLNCTKFGQLILRKIFEIVTTRCQILRLKCTKFDFGCDSAPDPLAGFNGSYFYGRGGRGGKGGGGREGKGRGGEGREEEGRLKTGPHGHLNPATPLLLYLCQMSFGMESCHFQPFPVVHGSNSDHDPLSPLCIVLAL